MELMRCDISRAVTAVYSMCSYFLAVVSGVTLGHFSIEGCDVGIAALYGYGLLSYRHAAKGVL